MTNRMMTWCAVALPIFPLACAANPAQSLHEQIAAIEKRTGGTIGVAFHDLETGQTYLHNERVSMHAASTMKVPVMLALFEAISRGQLRLDQPVPVRNEFISIFDGSSYALESREDSDKELYRHVGESRPLEELMRRMIVRSSNLATNLLIEYVGAPRVMELMRRIGAEDIQVLRGVEDDKAYQAGMNNTTTAYDMMLVLRAVAEQTAVSAEASRAMSDILAAQEFNEGIPAGVPPGTRVAHKTGWIPKISHDVAIVYPPGRKPYVLVVLSRGIEQSEAAEQAIAELSRVFWNVSSGTRDVPAGAPARGRPGAAAAARLLEILGMSRV
jgi:beta-lactamase class A